MASSGVGGPRPRTRPFIAPARLEALDHVLASGSHLLVTAPHGTGKTTLVATWAAARPDVTFRWIDAARSRGGELTAAAIIEQASTQAADRPSVLVVDAVERLRSSADLEDLVHSLADLDRCTVIILTTSIPHLKAMRSPRLTHWTHEHLAWDVATATRALEARGDDIPPNVIAQLVEYSHGRAAAILEGAATWTLGEARSDVTRRLTPSAIVVEWLVRTATDHHGPNSDRLLLAASTLLELPVALAGRLADRLDCDRGALDSLVAEGILIRRAAVLTRGEAFTVDHLLRDEFARLAEQREARLVRRLHSVAGRLADAGGFLAAYHAAMAGQAPVTAEFARRELLGLSAIAPDRFAPVLRALPLDALVANPDLAALAALFERSHPGRLPSAVAELDDRLLALPASRVRLLPPSTQMLVEAAVAHVLLERSGLIELVRRGEAALAGIRRDPTEPDGWFERALHLLHCALAEAALLQVRLDDSLRYAMKVSAAPAGHRWAVCAFRAASIAAVVHALSGVRAQLLDAVRTAELQFALAELPASPLRLPLDYARFIDAWNHGDHEKVIEAASRMHAVGRRSGPWSSLVHVAFGEAEFLRGGLVRGRSIVASVSERLPYPSDPPLVHAATLAIRALQLIAAGRPGIALRVLRGAASDPLHVFCFPSLRARALLALGRPRDALDAVHACARIRHSARSRRRLELLRAVANAEIGRVTTATDDFASALIGTPAEWRRGLLLEARFPGVAILLDALVAEKDTMPRELVDVAQRFGDRSVFRSGRLIPPLSDRELDLLHDLRSERTLAQIAAAQYVSINTIKSQCQSLYRKLGAVSREQAVDIALRVGLHVLIEERSSSRRSDT